LTAEAIVCQTEALPTSAAIASSEVAGATYLNR